MNQPNEQPVDVELQVSGNYHGDVIAWATEQAALLRAGQFDELDIENIAEEIESLGISERRQFENRLIVLLTHLLKQEYQLELMPNASWERTIKDQQRRLQRLIRKTPSLKPSLIDPEVIDDVWSDATKKASEETGLFIEKFPEECPYDFHQVIYAEDEE